MTCLTCHRVKLPAEFPLNGRRNGEPRRRATCSECRNAERRMIRRIRAGRGNVHRCPLCNSAVPHPIVSPVLEVNHGRS